MMIKQANALGFTGSRRYDLSLPPYMLLNTSGMCCVGPDMSLSCSYGQTNGQNNVSLLIEQF